MPGHHETERVTRRGQSFNTGISPVERNDSTGTDSMGVWQKLWESPAQNQMFDARQCGPAAGAGAGASQGQAARASNFLSCERSEDRADVIAGCSLPPRDRSSAIRAPIAASSSRLSNTIDTYSFFVEPICRTFIF